MRTLTAIALALGLALVASPSVADQNDPRLGELFARLKAAPDARAAHGVESSIWGIWTESDDDVIALLMNQGLAAMARRDLRAALGKFDQIGPASPKAGTSAPRCITCSAISPRPCTISARP